MPPPRDRDPGPIIGNTAQDQMMGRLIERCEVLQRQSDNFERALDSVASTTQSLDRTVTKLQAAVENIAPSATLIKTLQDQVYRLSADIENVERDLAPFVKLRDSILGYVVAIVCAAVLAGAVIGMFWRNIFMGK